MVLTDREIQSAIAHGHIKIQPAPDADAYSSTSLDLALSKFLRVWKQTNVVGVDQTVCPATEGYSFKAFSEEFSDPVEIGPDGYVLQPRSFVLGWTNEIVELPTHARIAARVEGKSSLARLGIGIHVTAPTRYTLVSGDRFSLNFATTAHSG